MGTSLTSIISAIPAVAATIAAAAKQNSTHSSSPSSSPASSPPAGTPAQTPGSTDYGELIQSAIAAGADAATVQGLVDKRIDKAASTPGLEQYAFDDIYYGAKDYIDKLNAAQPKAPDVAQQLRQVYDPNEGAYAQALAAQKAANDAAVQRAVLSLDAQKSDTSSEYADMFRQLYINKMNAQKNLNQQLGAQGITGGMAETSRLGLDTAYSEALRKGEQERIKTLSDLDRAITDTRLSGDLTYAQAAADAARANADSYAGVLSNLLNYYGMNERAAQQQAASEAADNRAYAYQIAMQMLGAGTMPTDELLTSAGIGKDDATAIAASALAAANAQKTSGGGGGSTKKYNATQAQTALAAAANGDTGDAVREIIESYYGLPMETVLASYGYDAPTGAPVYTPEAETSSGYSGIATGAQNLALRGATGLEVKNYLDAARAMDKINDAEYNALVNYAYGILSA